jgi:rubrerythrin
MAFNFNADEVLQMAVRIEQNGARFYRRAAEACSADDQTRSKFLELAEMEDCHEQTFAQIREGLRVEDSQSLVFDPQGEAAHYLAAMADANVFDPKADPADLVCDKSIEELLKIAIGLEKESIVFYLGLRDLVPARLGTDKVERILKEEMSHVALLRGQLAALG